MLLQPVSCSIASRQRKDLLKRPLRLATAIRGGTAAYPDFDAAVTRHRMLDAMVQASETGQKQVL